MVASTCVARSPMPAPSRLAQVASGGLTAPPSGSAGLLVGPRRDRWRWRGGEHLVGVRPSSLLPTLSCCSGCHGGKFGMLSLLPSGRGASPRRFLHPGGAARGKHQLKSAADSSGQAWNTQSKCESLSRAQLFATPWTVAHQAPLSMRFPRQEYWSGLPLPPPGVFPTHGSNLPKLAGGFCTM